MSGARATDLMEVHGRRSADMVLDEILGQLPDGVVLAYRGSQRLVAYHGGVFVLDPALDGVEIARMAASRSATRTREALAEHLSWVPFVDWFVVPCDDGNEAPGPVVPPDLLASTILEGHAVDDTTLGRIAALLGDGALSPMWHPGLPRGGGDLRSAIERLRPLG